jgi:hypothetical protein
VKKWQLIFWIASCFAARNDEYKKEKTVPVLPTFSLYVKYGIFIRQFAFVNVYNK